MAASVLDPEVKPACPGRRTADMRGLARRLRVRSRRGSALLEIALALVMFGIAVMAGSAWLQVEQARALSREAGRTVTVLADAARYHVQAHYENLLVSSASPISQMALLDDGILPAHFVFADEMKRDLTVLVLPRAGGVQVLSGQVPDPGDDRRPHAAVTQGRAGQRLGMVQTTRCPTGVTSPCLIGPGVEESVSGFASAFPGRVLEGAIMAHYEFDHDDFCGNFLHRTPTGLCTGANRMEQPVQIGGRLVNVAEIADVNRLEVHGALTVGCELEVGGTLTSQGRMTAGSGVTAVTATVTGNYGGGARNEACEDPSGASTPLSAVCNEDRFIVGRTLTVGDPGTGVGTADVLGRAGIAADTDAGDVDAGCLHVRGTATVEGRVRVNTSYGTPAGSCP